MPNKPPYDKCVFINCPFDNEYTDLFQAIIFTIHRLGFVPRCSWEIDDGGVRINKIIKIISECKYGIHDISRTELDKTNKLPRFNMPLELGIDMGCRYLGKRSHAEKCHLIIDTEKYRYQKFLSDLAGVDIKAHDNKPNEVIRIVRNWLKTSSKIEGLPTGETIQEEYSLFRSHFPRICKRLKISDSVPYEDYCNIVVEWLVEQSEKSKAKLSKSKS